MTLTDTKVIIYMCCEFTPYDPLTVPGGQGWSPFKWLPEINSCVCRYASPNTALGSGDDGSNEGLK